MKELEKLLNSLIQREWKPKDRKVVSIKLSTKLTKSEDRTIFYCNCKDGSGFYADLRWIVSLESGLWQFVCKNNLYKKEAKNFRENVSKVGSNIGWFNHNYQYRLLESALTPEKELGQFLVENIKVEGKKE